MLKWLRKGKFVYNLRNILCIFADTMINSRCISVLGVLLRILLCVCCGNVAVAAAGERLDSLMRVLDETIANRGMYQQQKENRLLELRNEYLSARDDTSRFMALGQLLDEYSPYDTDSAFSICRLREATARRIGDASMIANARMNTANILARTGMYKEALEILDSIDCGSQPEYLHQFYYHIRRTVYGLMAAYSVRDEDRQRYNALTMQYRDSVIACNVPGTLGHSINVADKLNNTGHPAEAIAVMEEIISNGSLGTHDMAMCAYTLSESYKMLGDNDRRKEQLIISAIDDQRSAVREYLSLRMLAVMLYQEGDVETAHKFLGISMDDAARCKAQLRVLEINEIYPLVNDMYLASIEKQKSHLRWLAVVISLLALMLLYAIFHVLKAMHKTAAARKALEQANGQLIRLNDELKVSNGELCEANRVIAENSYLKEEYIGRYMDQCLVYIEKLDSYRKSLGKLVSAGKIEQLAKTLKSSSTVDEELRAFYDNFDNTFLKLFPSFVDDFNGLLRPGEEIVPKKEGHLNTELRIFALIRLGITDSVKIAQFLRYSVTTIYNYRTKMRNKAAGDRNRLEEEVQRIGRSDLRSEA